MHEVIVLLPPKTVFQVSLSNMPSPQVGKGYYAWLLPDQDQSEANPRALGMLVISTTAQPHCHHPTLIRCMTTCSPLSVVFW